MELETAELDGIGGTRLFVRDHRRHSADRSTTLFCVHGLGEHGGRYAHLADWLVQRGWRVVVCDLRGHGRSSGSRTHVLSFDEYVQDLATVWKKYDMGSDRTILFGHSMGGLVTVRAVETGAVQPAALVMSSPLLGLKLRVNPLKELLGRLVVGFLPETRFQNGLDPNNMTHDQTFAEARRQDPLIVRTLTAGWYFAMRRALTLAHQDASKITIPILAIMGIADETTDGDALSEWMAKTKASSRALISLPDHVHEVFHESDWRLTAERMVEWLERLGVVVEK